MPLRFVSVALRLLLVKLYGMSMSVAAAQVIDFAPPPDVEKHRAHALQPFTQPTHPPLNAFTQTQSLGLVRDVGPTLPMLEDFSQAYQTYFHHYGARYGSGELRQTILESLPTACGQRLMPQLAVAQIELVRLDAAATPATVILWHRGAAQFVGSFMWGAREPVGSVRRLVLDLDQLGVRNAVNGAGLYVHSNTLPRIASSNLLSDGRLSFSVAHSNALQRTRLRYACKPYIFGR